MLCRKESKVVKSQQVMTGARWKMTCNEILEAVYHARAKTQRLTSFCSRRAKKGITRSKLRCRCCAVGGVRNVFDHDLFPDALFVLAQAAAQAACVARVLYIQSSQARFWLVGVVSSSGSRNERNVEVARIGCVVKGSRLKVVPILANPR
jgi:hypothetical protein